MKQNRDCKLNSRRILQEMYYIVAVFVIYGFVQSTTADICGPGLNTPGWTYPMGDIIVKAGDPLDIYCLLDPKKIAPLGLNATDIIWTIGGQEIESTYVTVVNETTSHLHIPSPPAAASVLYTCLLKADGSQGLTPSSSSSMESTSMQSMDKIKNTTAVCLNYVSVATPPAQVENFTCMSYNWERLVCQWNAMNYMKTEYTVTYNLKNRGARNLLYSCPNKTDILYNNCTWTESNYRRSHEFLVFNIKGNNTLGSINQSFTIHHYARIKPAPPANLRVLNKTPYSIELSWSNGNLNLIEKGLTCKVEYLYHLEGLAPSFWNVTVYPSQLVARSDTGEARLNVTGLKYPGVMYDFRVSCKPTLASDNSFYSEPATIVVKTKGIPPYRSPLTNIGSFEVYNQDSTSRQIYVYWQKMNVSEHNGDLFDYNISVFQDDKLLDLKPDVKTSSFAKFTKVGFGRYIFKIRAVNSEGEAPTDSIVVVPSKKEIMSEPMRFSKIVLGDSRYQLSWKPPLNYDDTINYTLFWCESNHEWPLRCDERLDWISVERNRTSFVTRLRPNITYQFAISANGNRSSSGMVWASCTAMDDKVEQMKNVWINHVSSTYIDIGWNLECSNRIGSIIGYMVHYCEIESDNCQEKKFVGDVHTEHANVTDLRPFTHYKLTIAAFTKAGQYGPRSVELSNRTSEGAPEVGDSLFRVTSVTNTSATITWTRPVVMNGIFRRYEVDYDEMLKVETNNTKVVLNNLTSYKRYYVKVKACTTICADIEGEHEFRTKIGMPSAVRDPSAMDGNETHVLLKWTAPARLAGPQPTYELIWLADNSSHTVLRETTSTQIYVKKPKCISGGSTLNTFDVRAKNTDEENVTHVGEASSAYTLNCFGPPISPLWRALMMMAVCGVAVAAFVFWGKRGLRRCRRMKNVEITLPSNFVVPPMFEKSTIEYPTIKWSEAGHLTEKNETSTEGVEVDLDSDPFSSGCYTGQNSAASSVSDGADNGRYSDSGTELDLMHSRLYDAVDDEAKESEADGSWEPVKTWAAFAGDAVSAESLTKTPAGYVTIQRPARTPGYVSLTPDKGLPTGYCRATNYMKVTFPPPRELAPPPVMSPQTLTMAPPPSEPTPD